MNFTNFNNTQIFEKISTLDLPGLEKLIAEKINVNQLSELQSTTPLIEAIKIGWLEGIKLLIKAGADVNYDLLFLYEGCTLFGEAISPLELAIHTSNYEIVNLLLISGADPNLGWFPLYYAVTTGKVDIVKTLIFAGAQVNRVSEFYLTPLMLAATMGRLDLVEILLSAGAEVDMLNPDTEETALVVAAHYGQKDVFDYLFPLTTCPIQRERAQKILPRGIILKQRRENQLLCDLIEATKEGDINRVREAIPKGLPKGQHVRRRASGEIASGVDVNAFGVDGECALHWAIRRDNEIIIEILLEAGADIEKPTENNQYTPLKLAAERGNFEAVNILIKRGANCNIIVNNKTPLMSAADSIPKEITQAALLACLSFAAELDVGKLEVLGGEYGDHTEVVKVLIDAGADINAKNNAGWTALMFAAKRNNKEVVKVLVAAGADINDQNNNGWTALMFAARNNNKEVVEVLVNAGADINAKNNAGWTALMFAAKSRNLEAYNFLVSAGADIEAKNHEGLDAQYYLEKALAEIPF